MYLFSVLFLVKSQRITEFIRGRTKALLNLNGLVLNFI